MEAAFETVIEAQLLAAGYTAVDGKGFDRERAKFPKGVTEIRPYLRTTPQPNR